MRFWREGEACGLQRRGDGPRTAGSVCARVRMRMRLWERQLLVGYLHAAGVVLVAAPSVQKSRVEGILSTQGQHS